MVATLELQVEVVGCPTVCRHCWAQGVPYPAMPVEDVAWVLEQAHRFCDAHRLGFGAYPMHELTAHPQAVELLRLFADHVGAAEFEPLSTTGMPLAVCRGVAAAPPPAGGGAEPPGPAGLVARQPGQLERVRQAGGCLTGPNPTDRGKPGSKCHLLVDRGGIPLAVGLSTANTHDSLLLEPMVDAVPAVKGPRGRPGHPRRRPAKLHGDKGYDYLRCRRALRRRGITTRIARRGIESSGKLGRHRYVVERSLAWLVGYRRLQVRYERRADILLGFLYLACALICFNSLNQSNA